MPKLSERGIIHLLLPLILLAGIIGGVFLITQGNPLKLFSKASNPPIVFKDVNGKDLPKNSSGIPTSTSTTVKVELTSPLGAPAGTLPDSRTISGPIQTGTVSYKIAETPTELNTASEKPYTKEPTIIDYTFQSLTIPSSVKFIWVEFKDNNGKTDRKSGQIEIVATPPSGGTGSGFQRVFVTSATYNGNLGGLTGADAKCQERANAANLGGTWKAWLSDTKTSASSRLNQSNNPYKLLDGTTIANNWADLTDGAIASQIAISETKAPIVFEKPMDGWVRTNTNTNGTIYSTSGACSNWQSNDGGNWGLTGYAVYRDNRWTNDTLQNCANVTHLYCFEQTSTGSPAPTSTPSPSPSPTPTSGKTSPCPPIGDVNDDKVITNADAQAASQIVARVAPYQNPTADQIKRADVNGDGKVDSGDSLRILRYIKGFDSTFKACTASLPQPNLGVESISISSPTNPHAQKAVGDSIDLDVVIKNYGNADVPSDKLTTTKVQVYKPNASSYTTACSPQLIGLIKAGASTTQKIRDCGKYELAGNYSINVTLDSANAVAESNEQDNTITSGVTVKAAVNVTSKRVFVTSTGYNGNLGGLSGADSKCQDRASAASLSGTFKAWLSDHATSVSSRLTQSKVPYKLLDGKVVANNWTDLTDGTIQNKINVTEFGKVKEAPIGDGTYVWTNSNVSGQNTYGEVASTTSSCNSWRSSSTGTGHFGSYNFADSKWTKYGQGLDWIIACNLKPVISLYCFEQ